MLPMRVLDESVLPQGALNVFNVLIVIYVAGITPLLIWRAYKHNKLREELNQGATPEEAAEDEIPEDEDELPAAVKAAAKKKSKRKGRK